MQFFFHTKKKTTMIPRLMFLTMKAVKRLPMNAYLQNMCLDL